MRKISLQWRLTILTTVLITVLCGCLTFFLYKNGVYYIDTLQETVTDQGTTPEAVYIDIPDNEWDDFAAQFATKVYNSKSDYRNRSLLITGVVALIGGAVTYFVSGRALKPLREFSETVEKVQAQNLTEYTIEENKIAELDRLRTSYNKMLLRLSESFETQRQFTRNEKIEMQGLIEEVLADLEPLAQEKNIELIQKTQNSSDGRTDGTEESLLVACSVNSNEKPEDELILTGSDILIYRMIYNLVENAIKYNRVDGTVTVSAKREKNEVVLTVADTGNGIDETFREQIFEPFFRVDKSRSRELGGVGLGLALVREIVRVHDGKIEVRGNEQGGTTFEVRMGITE